MPLCTRGGGGIPPMPRDRISLAPDFLAYLLGPPQRLLSCWSDIALRERRARTSHARPFVIVLYRIIWCRIVYLRCSSPNLHTSPIPCCFFVSPSARILSMC